MFGLIKCAPNSVGRRPFRWDAPDRANPGAKFFRRHVFAERCAGGLGNALFHERAAKIICACLQARERGLESQLDPGDLQVFDRAVQKDAREGVDTEVLVAFGTRPGSAMTIEPCILVDESERNDLRNSAGTFLYK